MNNSEAVETERHCGTCKFSSPLKTGEHAVPIGKKGLLCNWVYEHIIPSSMNTYSTFMFEDQGICCPCWKEKT